MSKPWLISVSGIMGTGKTTLARNLARALGWTYIPESMPAIKYLSDLFHNPERWAFEAQSAFIIHKAIQLQEARRSGQNIVLDRSLYEDSEIFARYFAMKGQIDSRSYATYQALAAHFLREIPPPDLLILCRCSVSTSKRRIKRRGRDYQKLYPPNHLSEITELYDEWLAHYRLGPVSYADSDRVDWRGPKVAHRLAMEVYFILSSPQSSTIQLPLFEISNPSMPKKLRYLTPVFHHPPPFDSATRPPIFITGTTSRTTRYPSAYIAAPFTAMAELASVTDEQRTLFGIDRTHGIIRDGRYKRTLLAIEKVLKTLGITSIIPHRDVNRWGAKALSPETVATLCTDYVFQSDIFVGLLGLSHGSHYEFGIAKGLNKPSILIRCDQIAGSFISQGLNANLGPVLTISCSELTDIPDRLRSRTVRTFLGQFVPLRQKGSKT